MKRKKLLSLLLVGAMSATLLAGCGGASEEEGGSGTEGGGSADTFTKFDEIQTIKIAQMNMIPGDNSAVIDAINKITEEKIGVRIEAMDQLDVNSYIEQLPKKMASGAAEYDLVMCTAIPMCSFTTWQSQNQLADITDLVDYYAPDAKELLKDYMASTTVNGKVYALPCYRQYNSNMYVLMREDLLETAGQAVGEDLVQAARDAKTWTDLEAIMQKVADSNTLPEGMKVFGATDNQGTMMTPGSSILGSDDFASSIGFDALGDTYKYIYVNPDTDTVENMFENEDYLEAVNRAWKWSQNGWTSKDNQWNLENAGDDLLSTDSAFSFLSTCEYGCEELKEAQYGKPLVAVKVSEIPITTQTGRQWSWAVPNASQNPEAAVAFLNLMFTDPDIENLLVYGVEGTDYDVVDGEAVVRSDAAYRSSDFFYGNQFNAYPAQGLGSDFREKALEDMKAAPISKYYGCVVSTDEIADTITNVHEVLKKYQWPLEDGVLDPATTIPEMKQALESAGLNEIIEYYQKALDSYLGK